MWEVPCNPRLTYGNELWACGSECKEKRSEQVLERRNTGRVLAFNWGGSERGLGMGKIGGRADKHRKAGVNAGDILWWPRIV